MESKKRKRRVDTSGEWFDEWVAKKEVKEKGLEAYIQDKIGSAIESVDIPDNVREAGFEILNAHSFNTVFNFSNGVFDYVCSINTDEYAQKHTISLFVAPENLFQTFPICSSKQVESKDLYEALCEVFVEAGNVDFTFPTEEFSWINRKTLDQPVIDTCKILYAEALFNDELSFAQEYGYDVEFLNGYYVSMTVNHADQIEGIVYSDNGTELNTFECDKDELKTELVKFAKCETDREIIDALETAKERKHDLYEDYTDAEYDDDYEDEN